MTTVRSADGTQIAYEVTGTGPAVVLIDAAGAYRDFNSLRPLADLLVLDSAGTGQEMNDGVDEIVKALPHSTHKRLDGEWHGLPVEVLAPELAQFYKD